MLISELSFAWYAVTITIHAIMRAIFEVELSLFHGCHLAAIPFAFTFEFL
jgi:hypothetical protein